MPQKDAWEKEYAKPRLIALSNEPRKDLKTYLKFLRKKEGVLLAGLRVLDLGSGNGKNANYIAEMGNSVVGIEISATAVSAARARAQELGVASEFILASIGEPFALESESFDVAIDVMASNSLNEKERAVYLQETHRVLRKSGHFFVRGLCKDGDTNAKNLLKHSPGEEYDTYMHKEMHLTERVFSREDFINTYAPYFEMQELTRKTNYAKFDGRIYKRNYWLAYMRKV